MQLTAEQHAEALKRYRHLKRARGFGVRACQAVLTDPRRVCTRASGHRGPHAAHGRFGRLLAVWDTGGSAAPPTRRAPARRAGRTPAKNRPVGLRGRDEPALPVRLARGVLKLLTQPEELALILMFIAFVYFGLDWLRIIFR